MNKRSQIILGAIGGIMLISIIIGGLFLYWVFSKMPSQEEFDRAEADGIKFGKSVDQNGCITEGLKRSVKTKRSMNNVKEHTLLTLFTENCLKSSRPVTDICEGVPAILSAKEHEWSMAECRKANFDVDETICMAVFGGKYNYCNMHKSTENN